MIMRTEVKKALSSQRRSDLVMTSNKMSKNAACVVARMAKTDLAAHR